MSLLTSAKLYNINLKNWKITGRWSYAPVCLEQQKPSHSHWYNAFTM